MKGALYTNSSFGTFSLFMLDSGSCAEGVGAAAGAGAWAGAGVGSVSASVPVDGVLFAEKSAELSEENESYCQKK